MLLARASINPQVFGGLDGGGGEVSIGAIGDAEIEGQHLKSLPRLDTPLLTKGRRDHNLELG